MFDSIHKTSVFQSEIQFYLLQNHTGHLLHIQISGPHLEQQSLDAGALESAFVTSAPRDSPAGPAQHP